MEFICSNKLDSFVEDLIFDKIEKDLRLNISPKFWSYFRKTDNEMEGFESFKVAVDTLYNDLSSFIPILRKMEIMRSQSGVERILYGENKLENAFKVLLRSVLHAQLPLKHQTITEHFYRVAFKVFCNSGECL